MPGQVYKKRFWILCLSSVIFFCSFNMIIPELADFLTQLGGAEYKGLIISLFTLSAGLSRPFAGRLSDRVGRLPVMIFGVSVCLICGVIYPQLVSIWGFFALRFFHGFATGFKPTATAAYIADIVPAHRRGEAMGIYGMANNIGLSLGPTIGSWIAGIWSVDAMFYISSALAVLSIGILMGLPETLKERQKLTWDSVKVTWDDVVEPGAIRPFLVFIFYSFSYGVVLTLIPDFCAHFQMENKGVPLTVMTVASLFVRLIAGRTSDRIGRIPVLRVGLLCTITGMTLMGSAGSTTQLIIGSAVFGLGVGINSPALFAWTIDGSDPNRRGRGIGFLYLGLEIGIGSGAFFSGMIYANSIDNLPAAFYTGVALAVVPLLYLILDRRENRPLSD